MIIASFCDFVPFVADRGTFGEKQNEKKQRHDRILFEICHSLLALWPDCARRYAGRDCDITCVPLCF